MAANMVSQVESCLQTARIWCFLQTSRKEQVMASLSSIRVGKTKLVNMLNNLKQFEQEGEVCIAFDSSFRLQRLF